MGQNLLGRARRDGFIDIRNATTPRPTGPGDPGADYDAKTRRILRATGVDLHVHAGLSRRRRTGGHLHLRERLAGGNGPPVVWTLGAMSEAPSARPGDADSVVTVGAHATKACWQGSMRTSIAGSRFHPGSDRSLHEPGAAPRRRVQTGPHSTRARRHLVAFGGLRGGGAARDRADGRAREFSGTACRPRTWPGPQRFSWRGANGPPPDHAIRARLQATARAIASPARCRTGSGVRESWTWAPRSHRP